MFKLQVSTIKREAEPGRRRTATAAAAYRSGTAITDARTGEVYDYTKKSGVEYAELIMPPGVATPDRQELWNAAEAAETRKNSVVAREIMVALPAELNGEARTKLVLAFACHIAAIHKCAVDVAIHAPGRGSDERNYHAHLLCTTRRIEQDGTFGQKTRELDNRKSGAVEALRERWADLANEELERSGSRTRIDHRSYARQGILRVPGVHLGHKDAEAERLGIRTERGDLNRAAEMINAALADVVVEPGTQPDTEYIYSAAVTAVEKEIETRAASRDQAGRAMEKEIEHTAPDPEPEPEPEPAEPEEMEEEEWDEDLEEEKARYAAEQAEKEKRDRRARDELNRLLAQTAKSSIPDPPPAAAVEPAPAPGQPPPAKIDPTAPGADYYAKKAARKAAEQAAAAAAARQEEQVSIKDDKQKSSPAIGLTGRQPERHETALERRLREHRADMERKGVYTKTPAQTERERGR